MISQGEATPCYCDYMGGMCGYCIDALREEDEERERNRDLREVYPPEEVKR